MVREEELPSEPLPALPFCLEALEASATLPLSFRARKRPAVPPNSSSWFAAAASTLCVLMAAADKLSFEVCWCPSVFKALLSAGNCSEAETLTRQFPLAVAERVAYMVAMVSSARARFEQDSRQRQRERRRCVFGAVFEKLSTYSVDHTLSSATRDVASNSLNQHGHVGLPNGPGETLDTGRALERTPIPKPKIKHRKSGSPLQPSKVFTRSNQPSPTPSAPPPLLVLLLFFSLLLPFASVS